MTTATTIDVRTIVPRERHPLIFRTFEARGALRVSFREPIGEGVTGVIANVISMLTGGAHDGGFFRRDLLAFGADQPLALRFALAAAGAAGADELRRFGELWQDRVRRLLLEHGDDPEVFRIRPRA